MPGPIDRLHRRPLGRGLVGRRRRWGRLILLAALWPAPMVAQERPLSAIDWLSAPVERRARPPEPPVTVPGPVEPIVMSPLPRRNLDAIGTDAPPPPGVGADFWSASQLDELAALIGDLHPEILPVLDELLQELLAAPVPPPAGADGTGAWLLVRVDKLLELGALEPAAALLVNAGPPTPELFRRAFDIALLLGEEDRACAEQRAMPGISSTLAVRIFCLARGDDWAAADVVFATARTLEDISPEEEELLEHFLDPALFEDSGPPRIPQPLTPLVLRMLDAIGENTTLTGLPLAFAWGELAPTAGWKARLEAAERLARVGAITPGRLFALYSERRPAASGGVWERVAAVQKLATALAAGDAGAVAATLEPAWNLLAEVELEIPFARQYGPALATVPLRGAAWQLAWRIGLLGPDYAGIAMAHEPVGSDETFLAGLAQGVVTAPPPLERMARAIAPVFAAGAPPELSPVLQGLLDAGRPGQAVLTAIARLTAGVAGDLRAVSDGLALLRRLGFEDVARRAALQLILLERRG